MAQSGVIPLSLPTISFLFFLLSQQSARTDVYRAKEFIVL